MPDLDAIRASADYKAFIEAVQNQPTKLFQLENKPDDFQRAYCMANPSDIYAANAAIQQELVRQNPPMLLQAFRHGQGMADFFQKNPDFLSKMDADAQKVLLGKRPSLLQYASEDAQKAHLALNPEHLKHASAGLQTAAVSKDAAQIKYVSPAALDEILKTKPASISHASEEAIARAVESNPALIKHLPEALQLSYCVRDDARYAEHALPKVQGQFFAAHPTLLEHLEPKQQHLIISANKDLMHHASWQVQVDAIMKDHSLIGKGRWAVQRMLLSEHPGNATFRAKASEEALGHYSVKFAIEDHDAAVARGEIPKQPELRTASEVSSGATETASRTVKPPRGWTSKMFLNEEEKVSFGKVTGVSLCAAVLGAAAIYLLKQQNEKAPTAQQQA